MERKYSFLTSISAALCRSLNDLACKATIVRLVELYDYTFDDRQNKTIPSDMTIYRFDCIGVTQLIVKSRILKKTPTWILMLQSWKLSVTVTLCLFLCFASPVSFKQNKVCQQWCGFIRYVYTRLLHDAQWWETEHFSMIMEDCVDCRGNAFVM
jgi:hypothetical protein